MQNKLIRLVYFGLILCFVAITAGVSSADEVGVYNNEGTWALWNTNTNSADIVGFGWAGSEPVVGDWDGDGVTEVGIYNTGGNNFLIQTDSEFDAIGLGWPGVTPVVGDWNGDGKDDVGVYNNEGTWALWNTNTNSADIVGFGWAGSEPVVCDWDGDGVTEVGIYNTGGNNFLIQTDSGFDAIGLGWPGVTQVVGTWSTQSTFSHVDNTPIFDVSILFVPSGWMGDTRDVSFNRASTKNPYTDSTCILIKYSPSGPNGWAGIYWQYPKNNWGNIHKGRDLSATTKVTFFARGENGGEKAEFKVGGITGQKYEDSIKIPVSTGKITLSNEWKQYTIDLRDQNLEHVIGGFCWVTSKNDNPSGCTIYLDDIRYE